ncbi:uncharacterized protein LOC120354454 [Nilaparvata lugens]|uniref:uncharacterized protein LOC120354454 n=1 Tax=Nilaparvata lugens TaxID=108931 RepID=UPI00193DDD10|nr:uncharacterized protein LOC120354454 [Nilaparvata lugens]
MGSRPTGQKASNEEMESALTKYSRTSITNRQNIVIINDKNVELEAQSVKGWMGMSLPPKKRRVKGGYYWRACPDFQCLEDSRQIKIGVLKNGINPSSKTKRIGSKHITLSNTCRFDAPCQVLAIAYCDSVNYRNYVDQLHLENTIMEIAVELARKGTNHSLYMKRAVLLSKYSPHELLKGGVERVDCASSSSYMLRNVKLPPSMTEKYNCSSPHCPGGKEREIAVLSAMVDDKESTIERLEDALLSGETDDRTTFLPMGDVSHVSPENFINDPEISKKVI